MDTLIDVQHLCFNYGQFAIRDVSTRLSLGENKALVGKNGSGKTTLLKLIVGLLRPTSGEVFIFNKRVEPQNLWSIRQQIGFLFQDPNDHLFAPTVWEDVSFGPRNMGLPLDEVRERVRWSLELVGLSDMGDRSVHELSYGQAKRAALAGLLAMRPKILILDEPFAGLDFAMTESLIEILESLRANNVSILYTTHERFFIENWADSMIVLQDGAVVYDGTVENGLDNDTVIKQIGNWQSLENRLRRRTVTTRYMNGL